MQASDTAATQLLHLRLDRSSNDLNMFCEPLLLRAERGLWDIVESVLDAIHHAKEGSAYTYPIYGDIIACAYAGGEHLIEFD